MTDRTKSISVALANDHPLILLGVAELLRAHPDIEVVASCTNGRTVMQAIRQMAPTVAVLDFFIPGLNGLEVLAKMSAERSATKAVFLTATATNRQLLNAMSVGAKGIVFKETALDELVQCIRIVAAGREWLPRSLIDAALEREATGQSVSKRLLQSLTCRERQIVLLVAEGLSNKEMCRRLGLREGTVKIHLHNVYEKIGVNNRTALAAMAVAGHEDLLGHEELLLLTAHIHQRSVIRPTGFTADELSDRSLVA
jgi:two-component system, NarL family, nitrate/nitrite response regulator NarL